MNGGSGLLGIYYGSAVVTFITLVVFISMSDRKVLFYNASYFMFILLSNLGSLFVATSNNVEEAILGNKVIYFCGCALPIFLIMLTCDACRVEVNKFVRMLMYGYNCIVMLLAMTVGFNKIFYSSTKIVNIQGVTVLIREYGPAHVLFLILLYGYMGGSVGVIVYSLIKRKNLIYRNVFIMLISYSITFLAYVFGKKLLGGLEPICVAYSLDGIILLFLTYNTSLYNLDEALLASIEKQDRIGFILLDRKYRYYGCNEVTTSMIPEVATLRMGRRVDVSDDSCLSQILRVVNDFDSEHTRNDEVISCNDIDLRVNVQYLYKENRVRGYIVSLTDDSKVQGYIRELDMVSKNKSSFLSNVSHEIRTPINAVLGMNEMILRECKEEAIREYAMNIEESGRTLLQLINDVLDLSKIESGKFEVIADEYDLASLICELEDMITPLAAKKGLQFKVETDSMLPKRLYGDKVRVKQMVTNTLTNAVKYTVEGSVTLRIYGERKDDDFIINFSVKDTGKGIKREDIGNLFNAFERVDQLKNSGIEGTGLGLAITKKFAVMMGGNISVESIYGEGSDFIVTVPQRIVGDELMGDYHNNDNPKKRDKYVPKFIAPTAKVLVVDDVKMNLTVVKLLLKETQMKISCVKSGMECIEEVQKEKFDIILLDHMMPELDGVGTLKIIKDNHYCDDTPIIALTANATVEARETYRGYGFTDYLAKPIDAEELEHMLVTYLPQDKYTGVTGE